MRLGVLAGAIGLVLLAQVAAAEPIVSIDGAWCALSRARPGVAFVYLTLSVRGAESDTLLGAQTSIADRARIVTPRARSGRDGVMPTESVAIDGNAPTVFQPRDTHIVLQGLSRPLMPGDSFTITLDFARAGKVEAPVAVVRKPPSADMPDLPAGTRME
jgi:hypothetical protein